MAGRRARTGRGWDASPPRSGDADGGPPRPRRGRRGGPNDEDPPEAGAEVSRDAGAPPRDEAELAREICLRQLELRPRTRAELAAELAKRGISVEVSAEVLDRYDEVGIVDDAAFARAWVSSRHAGRGLARRALATELRRRGVDGEVASEALGELDEETEAETARVLVERKLRTARGEPDAVFRRLVGMLARKGYPPGVAIRAVKDALAAQSAEAAEFADRIDADALADAEGDLDRESRPLD
ncbi:regulatory protein RecX [Micromonospora sp. KC207]|uniref:regulatory protein RecX n=1 Tax=Micromonospora sp. KC207 TaxID=2530377 RepID=UPI0010466D7C|nr:regulatory protein RecX [Micromonospora sp. KC207]TDC58142.1 regulatory protein RecX [Micromonospora sp. KC207]